jgi:hypothetical protein
LTLAPLVNFAMTVRSNRSHFRTLKRAAIEAVEHGGDVLHQVINRIRYKALADPKQLVWVAPDSINRYSSLFVRKRKGAFVTGSIIDGDWDRSALPIAEHLVYLGLRERFVYGVPWEQTTLFRNEGYLYVKTGAPAEVCRQRDRLYESIKAHGVLPNHPPPPEKKEEGVKNVIVFIGRDGEFIFSGRGWHRLCMAKFLKVPRMPVDVLARHPKWQRVREVIARNEALESLGDEARRHLSHPDLADLLSGSRYSCGETA